MSVIALIPARSGSKGIPGKNFRQLGGKTLIQHAVDCAHAAQIGKIAISSDAGGCWPVAMAARAMIMRRPAELAQDDTPMLAVVQHALQQIPGQPDDIIVLLQPTQPFRKPEHIQQAIALLQESGADSVVSVVPLPLTHAPEFQCVLDDGTLDYGVSWPQNIGLLRPHPVVEDDIVALQHQPTRRQDVRQTYRRDGTVYCFWRKSVGQYGFYGPRVRPLIIDPAESCELDTEADWADCVRRWEATHG